VGITQGQSKIKSVAWFCYDSLTYFKKLHRLSSRNNGSCFRLPLGAKGLSASIASSANILSIVLWPTHCYLDI